jgi:hypothetical protein
VAEIHPASVNPRLCQPQVESKLHKLPSDAKKARLGTGPSEEKRGWEPRLKVWGMQP